MRVNLIGSYQKNTGVSQDIEILQGLIVHVFGKDTEIRPVPHFHPQCLPAELNIFVETINPALFVYAAKNVWIPNPEWTYKTWEPYARMVDEVWVKTREAEKLFQDWNCKTRYIGWTSIDKMVSEKKNFSKALVPSGKNIWRNPRPIIQVYMAIHKQNSLLFHHLPELHIVHQPEAIPLPPLPDHMTSKIILHSEVMPQEEYDALLRECGLCICMSAAEGFGHAVNESMSSGSILMLSPIDAFVELAPKNSLWVSELKHTAHPQCLGNLLDVDLTSMMETLRYYVELSLDQRRSMSDESRDLYERRHATFIKRMEEVMSDYKDIPPFNLEDRLMKEEDMPPVSIITITRDRRAFIPLAKYCYLAQVYPDNKVEWVIVDDGKDPIKDLITDLPNVKYILVDEQLTIGEKRNLGIEHAAHDVLIMMDDDDVYPKHSLLTRVAYMMAEPKKECLFSTTIPCYDIHGTKSFMNVPPITLPMSQRVSEATLCFTRSFWQEREFPDQQIAEGESFIKGREERCRELSPQDVIVSLVHKKNTSSRKPPQMETNGCHYRFADELFTLVSEIGLSIE